MYTAAKISSSKRQRIASSSSKERSSNFVSKDYIHGCVDGKKFQLDVYAFIETTGSYQQSKVAPGSRLQGMDSQNQTG